MGSEQDLRKSIRSHAHRMLQHGFLAYENIQTDLRHYADDEASDNDLNLDDPTLDRMTSEELAAARKAHRSEMAAWPKVTDCDRLDAAFAELNAMGIMARHNWTCCGNCGAAEMPDELKRLKGKINNKPIIGYIFYHQQGTDNAGDNRGVHFSFGSTQGADSEAEYEAKSIAIARTACDVLAKHGLRTNWDGTYQRRPFIYLDWKRRGVPKDYVDCDGPCNGAPQSPSPQLSPRSTQGATAQPRSGLIARIASMFRRTK